MAYGFDIGTFIKLMIDKILEIELPLIVYMDFKSLYECLVKLSIIQEKRLMVNVMCFR
jgi:hypothetical protein